MNYEDEYDEEDVEYQRAADNIFDARTRKPRVLSDKCETCIFHGGNRMRLKPGRVKQMTHDAINGGGYITCHSTLPGAGNPTGMQAAVCGGFFESFGHLSNVLRVYGRLGSFEMVPPPAKEA